MWGIIPAAGNGTRIQPLAFSKELLPVGGRLSGDGRSRPKAVSEFLVDRMALAGASKVCFVISPHKADILKYYGGHCDIVEIAYVVQPEASGLCDAIFRAHPVIPHNEPVLVGLPDTIWFPDDALRALPDDRLSFLLFPVEQPQFFDAVVTDADGRVLSIDVKSPDVRTNWIWGAFKMPGHIFHELREFWLSRPERDEYIGTLINAWIAQGGRAQGVRAGTLYADVGTLEGYRLAMELLSPEPVRAAL
ncbi:nucleotidyltransferase family protein [Rubellimicrobium rubrum]|uniref:glucose-1-phosphate thymidylyltransferase n=1 Tax=Rubellimicrobium rubrum TaxID=2585369 RepID=A0A5C4MT19_9RHOB|nr:nucleotidyltransferase family protein [Rubellimicrobium rubrum]TNC48482.1 nucleotidyltransferase family protein [Rubellimicrobium rubrum]